MTTTKQTLKIGHLLKLTMDARSGSTGVDIGPMNITKIRVSMTRRLADDAVDVDVRMDLAPGSVDRVLWVRETVAMSTVNDSQLLDRVVRSMIADGFVALCDRFANPRKA